MTDIFMRIIKHKEKSGLSWNELAEKADIAITSWMTGIPTSSPSNEELRRLAPLLGTTYDYLKYGR